MSKELVKLLLNNSFYEDHKDKISDNFFPDKLLSVYQSLKDLHETYKRDITLAELWEKYKVDHPTMTLATKKEIGELFNTIRQLEDIGLDIGEEILTKVWIEELEREAADLLISGGDIDEVISIVDRIKSGNILQEEVEYVTTDVYEMLEQVEAKHGFTWNLPVLQDAMGNIPKDQGVLGVIAARPDCYSDDTEILTEQGWKLFKDLDRTEKVAQVDEHEEVSFVYPTDYIENDYQGDMVSFKQSQGRIDLLVTPNHDMVLKNRKNELVKIKAKDNIPSNYKYIHSGSKKGFNFTLTPYQRFLIAYQADGSTARKGCTGERGHFTVRFSFKKQRKVDRLINILNEAQLKYSITKDKTKENYTTIYVQCKELPSKNFDWIDLSKVHFRWGEKFIEELSYWDATRRTDTRIKYDTTIKFNADVVSSICALSGMQCNHSVFEDTRSDKFSDIHSLSILTNRNFSEVRSVTKSKEYYYGKVYCVTVPHGRIIVRRNNKVAVAGNCGKTAFYVSLVYGEEGWLEQGAKVHIICNEEPAIRTQVRGLGCWTGKVKSELLENKDLAKDLFEPIKDNIFVQDKVNMSIEELDTYVSKNEVDVLIIDQLDKLSVKGMYNRSDEKLRVLYTSAREISKKYNCLVLAITQAGAGAAGKMHYGFEELDGSKTGKAAEADFVFCVGMKDPKDTGGIDDYVRCINIPKNKLSGFKQPVFYTLEPEYSRMRS